MQVHIAYLPGYKHTVSSEQIKALVKTCSRRLQIQERLTQEIADGVDSLTGTHFAVLLYLLLQCRMDLPHCTCLYFIHPVAEPILSTTVCYCTDHAA